MNTGYYNEPLHFGLSQTVKPTAEPVTLEEAKLWCRQEADYEDEDDVFEGLITAARIKAEVDQKRQLMPATYLFRLDQFPVTGRTWCSIGPTIVLPYPKLRSVTSIVYTNQAGVATTLDSSRYLVDLISQPGRITPAFGQAWPETRAQAGSVAVTYVAGYANAADVPESTKLAMKLLIAHWYRNREAVGTVGGPLAFAVDTLLSCDAAGTYG